MGLNHEQLTYRYFGCDDRLTDVSGHVVHNVTASNRDRSPKSEENFHNSIPVPDAEKRLFTGIR